MKNVALTLLIATLLTLSYNANSQGGVSERMDSIYRNKEANLPAWTLNFNLADIVLYGPIFQIEFKISNRGYLVPWLRYSYAGMVSQYNWTNFDDYNKFDPVSTGIALGYKKFIPGDQNRHHMYWGFFGEFIYEKGLKDTDVPAYEYEQTRTAAAAYVNVGYRWKSRRNFYLSLGVLPGFAYNFQYDKIYTESGGPVPGSEPDKYNFIGIIDFSCGWNFEK